MKYIIVEVSDKKKKNTTLNKIKETLSRYDLSKTDKVIFFVKDLFYLPKNVKQWIKIIESLKHIVFVETYYRELYYSDDYKVIDIPEIEIKLSKKLKTVCQY